MVIAAREALIETVKHALTRRERPFSYRSKKNNQVDPWVSNVSRAPHGSMEIEEHSAHSEKR